MILANDFFSRLKHVLIHFLSLVLVRNDAKFYLLYDQVWQFRRVVLEALNANLEEELEYLDGIAEGNPKNYQIWYGYSVQLFLLLNYSCLLLLVCD